jgi:hypothetical protein
MSYSTAPLGRMASLNSQVYLEDTLSEERKQNDERIFTVSHKSDEEEDFDSDSIANRTFTAQPNNHKRLSIINL